MWLSYHCECKMTVDKTNISSFFDRITQSHSFTLWYCVHLSTWFNCQLVYSAFYFINIFFLSVYFSNPLILYIELSNSLFFFFSHFVEVIRKLTFIAFFSFILVECVTFATYFVHFCEWNVYELPNLLHKRRNIFITSIRLSKYH